MRSVPCLGASETSPHARGILRRTGIQWRVDIANNGRSQYQWSDRRTRRQRFRRNTVRSSLFPPEIRRPRPPRAFTRASKHVRISNYFRRPREALFRAGDFGADVGFVAIYSYTDT